MKMMFILYKPLSTFTLDRAVNNHPKKKNVTFFENIRNV